MRNQELVNVIGGLHLGDFLVFQHGVLHDARRWTDAAVVQVDDVAVNTEGFANLKPEIFVAGEFARGATGGFVGGGENTGESE